MVFIPEKLANTIKQSFPPVPSTSPSPFREPVLKHSPAHHRRAVSKQERKLQKKLGT